MDLNVGKELSELRRASVDGLRARYAEVFGEPTNGRHKDWLVKRIIWRIQSLAEGDLTERARQRAAEIVNDADVRRKAPKIPAAVAAAAVAAAQTPITLVTANGDRRVPIPGSVIIRVYKRKALEVHVLADGFEFEGEKYKSLSAVAKQITGTHCNGYHFFRLKQVGGAK